MEFTGPVVFFTALATMILSQAMKMAWITLGERRFRPDSFFELSGMPSSHTATATSLVAMVYLTEGFSVLFAIMTVALIYVVLGVLFDKWSLSSHAKIINEVIPFIRKMGHRPEKHNHLFEKQMREEWGHTPLEITTGFLVGLAITLIVYII